MILEVNGIIVARRNYQENDVIITIFAEDSNLYQVKVVGARRIKNVNRGKSQLLNYGKFVINVNENKFSTLKNAEIKNSNSTIKLDIEKYYNTIYLCELITKSGYYASHEQFVYEEFMYAVDSITNNNEYFIVRTVFEFIILKSLGVQPNFENCVLCHNNNIVAISSHHGGFICVNCYNESHHKYSTKSLGLLKGLSTVSISKIKNISLSENIISEIEYFINDYYATHVHITVNSKQMIKEMGYL